MLGGKYKAAENVIAETGAEGRERVRFKPLPSFETPAAVEELCAAFNGALDAGKIDPLLLIPRFLLDFLCIHPFADGNGRMSRLLCLLLLYRSGYLVGKYISLEMIIEQTRETYYEALETGSIGWHEAENDCLPFVRHFLEVLLKAYREFSFRVGLTFNRSLSKPERVRSLFESTLGQLSKKDILGHFPDISTSTVEAGLSALLKEGFISKVGAGKKTKYIKVRN
jgi:Fic family protein